MSRALGMVAEAVAAVIAAEIQTELNVSRAEARAIGRRSVASLRGDGWHITAGPAQFAPDEAREHDPRLAGDGA